MIWYFDVCFCSWRQQIGPLYYSLRKQTRIGLQGNTLKWCLQNWDTKHGIQVVTSELEYKATNTSGDSRIGLQIERLQLNSNASRNGAAVTAVILIRIEDTRTGMTTSNITLSTAYATSNSTLSMTYDNPQLVDKSSSASFIAKVVVLSLVCLGTVLGNGLIIAAVFVVRQLRRRVSNTFIASLALTDLLIGLVVLPLSTSYEVLGYWPIGSTACKVWTALNIWVCTASTQQLCVISIDRYIAIAHPLKYPQLISLKRCRIICLAVWIVSLLVASPSLMTWPNAQNDNNSTNEMDVTAMQCHILNNSISYSVYALVGTYLLPAFVIVIFYSRVFILAKKYAKQSHRGSIEHKQPKATKGMWTSKLLQKVRPKTPSSPVATLYASSTKQQASRGNLRICRSDKARTNSPNLVSKNNIEAKAAKTLAIIVGTFLMCWTPFFVCHFLTAVLTIHINQHLYSVITWLAYSNSLLNPCIYAVFARDYRRAFRAMLRCETGKSGQEQPQISFYSLSIVRAESPGINERTCRTKAPA